MRRLQKGLPIPAFTDCVRQNRLTNWDEFSASHRPISHEVRLHILCEEQDSLCGYTELPISDPYKCHIDHYRKKSLFAELTFDWQNFVVATMDDDFGARYKDLVYKIKKKEYALILNPVVTDVQDYFFYPDYDPGNILPKPGLDEVQKRMAEKTIEVFNLRDPALINRRRRLLQMLIDYQDLSPEEIRAALAGEGFKSLVEQFTR